MLHRFKISAILSAALLCAAHAPAQTVSWVWDGAADPGFTQSHPDASTYYDSAAHALHVGFGARPNVPYEGSGTTSYYKTLPFALADATVTVEYSIPDSGYVLFLSLANKVVTDYIAGQVSEFGALLYDGPAGRLTYLTAYDSGASLLHDVFLSTAHPLQDTRYRLTTWRAAGTASGRLETWTGSDWAIIGEQGPLPAPGLSEPLNVLRFDQGASGDFGVAMIHSISVSGTPAAPCPGDLNNDRVVDLTDLAKFLANFGVVCP